MRTAFSRISGMTGQQRAAQADAFDYYSDPRAPTPMAPKWVAFCPIWPTLMLFFRILPSARESAGSRTERML